jgi:hypothetical protein
MTNTIVIGFEDFKRLATDNKRIYYFNGSNFYDFCFLSDGMIVKTTLAKELVTNPTQFFSDKIFYGAMELKFAIPNPESDWTNVDGLKSMLKTPLNIQNFQTEEVKDTDIQIEGVEDTFQKQ